MNFIKDKCQVQHLGRNNPQDKKVGADRQGSSFAEKDWGSWWTPG